MAGSDQEALRHFALVRSEGGERLSLLPLGNSERIERPCQLGRDLIEIGQILAQRIATEERALYPLYLTPDRY